MDCALEPAGVCVEQFNAGYDNEPKRAPRRSYPFFPPPASRLALDRDELTAAKRPRRLRASRGAPAQLSAALLIRGAFRAYRDSPRQQTRFALSAHAYLIFQRAQFARREAR